VNDRRIRVFSTSENWSIGKNKNYLLKYVIGEFIAPIDSEDISLPNRFKV